MTWTNPRTWLVGEIDTHALMNTYVRDNQLHLFNTAVPAGVLILFNGTVCPSGYTEHTASRGFLLQGLPSGGTVGGTVGTALGNLAVRTVTTVVAHTHTVSAVPVAANGAHTHFFQEGGSPGGTLPFDINSISTVAGAGTLDTTGAHAHSVSGSVSSNGGLTDVAMPYIQLLVCRKT
jgi:hypothetical protein